MTHAQITVFAVVLGLVLGAAVTLGIVLALRARDRYREQVRVSVPAGVVAVLTGMDDPTAVVDASFRMLATSPNAAALSLRVGQSIDSAEVRALVRSARSSGLSESTTLRLRTSTLSAESRLVVARATPLGGQLTFVVLRDISEQERLEEMRRDFVANTSHELKTPVGAVQLLAEAVDMAADDPDQVRRFAARLQAEAQRLNGLTARIMNLSKLQTGDELRDMRRLAVDEIVRSVVEAHEVQAAGAEIELVCSEPSGHFVRGDAQILRDALSNLVTNAIHYSSPSSRVGIGVKRVDDVIEIAVSDQGVGIAEHEQQRIFERFYRSDQARSRATGGTGLGLSIVKHAVQRHGGDMRLWSKPGRGSTFTMLLPAVEGPDAGAAKAKKAKRKLKHARVSAQNGDAQ